MLQKPARVLSLIALAAMASPAVVAGADRRFESVSAELGVIRASIEKGAELATPLCAGGNIFYSLSLTNLSDPDSGALPASIVDPIPAGTSFAGGLSPGASFDQVNGRITWTGLLVPGQKVSVGFSVTVNVGVQSGAVLTNTVSGLVGELPVQVSLPITVNCLPLTLSVAKSRQLTAPLCPGSNIFYSVALTNTSGRSNTLDATLEDPIPIGTTFAGSLSEGAVFDAQGKRVTWSGTLHPGQVGSVSFAVTVNEGVATGSVLTNRATGTVTDPLVGDSRQEQVSVEDLVDCPPPIPIEVAKTSSSTAPLCPGGRIDYQVTLTNASLRENLLDARISDPLPSNTHLVEGSLTGGAKFFPFAPPNADLVLWDGKLGPGETKTIGFSVTVADGLPNGTVITNRATGRLSDPLLTDQAEKEAQTADTVDCVKLVVPPKTWVEQTVFLWNLNFTDDMDGLLRGLGDMYYAWWTNHVGDERSKAQTGASKDELKIDDGETFGVTEAIFRKKVCCREPDCNIPPLEIYLDFWDDDDSTAEKILNFITGLGELVAEVDKRADRAVEGIKLIDETFELSKIKGKNELGVLRNLALLPPAPCLITGEEIEQGKAVPCDPDSGEVMEGVVCTEHKAKLNRGAGAENGTITLAWRTFDTGETCNEIADPEGTGSQLRRVSVAPAGGEDLRIETELIDLQLRAVEPIRIRTRIEQEPEGSPEVLAAASSATAGVHVGADAFLVETELGLVDGVVIPNVTISSWNGEGWNELGVPPILAEVTGDRLSVVVDHREVGDFDRFALVTELYRGEELLDVLPADPGERRIMDWTADRSAPGISAVRLVPPDGELDESGEPFPFGAVARIEVVFSERVELTESDVGLVPAVPLTMVLKHNVLTLLPMTPLGPAQYRLTLRDSIRDLAGIALDGNDDNLPGGSHEVSFSILARSLFASDVAGAPRGEFAFGESIYASGEGLPAGWLLDLYLVPDDSVQEGGTLADSTVAGKTSATVGPGGGLPPTDLSPSTQAGEYSLVADLDRDGIFQSVTDLLWDPRGIGVNVADPAPGVCVPGTTTMCLNDGRFQLEVDWATPLGIEGPGQAVHLTTDSGYFWFFDPDNVELLVKVLDACSFGERFWVFAGGLTNVEVEMTVTDTRTQEFRTYSNSQKTPFQPILDTNAFATCEASGSPARESQAALPFPSPLQLNDDRFRVEVEWSTPQGTSGAGRAVALTDNAGYYWFFDPDNIEMLVKVLDACSFADRFWVFAGGLTNVEVVMTVTDTQKGEARTYRNPQRAPFQPILDTGAFATCP